MVIYGKQVCLYALRNHEEKIKTVYLLKKGILPTDLLRLYGPKTKFLENRWAQSMSRGGNHQGILVEMETYSPVSLNTIKMKDFVVILDRLTDVGNIGAIVRSAYALGVDGIIVTGIRQLNYAAVARTSSGALLDMPLVLHQNISEPVNELRQAGFRIYGAAVGGEPLEKKTFMRKRVLILGNEEKGLSKKILQKLDETVSVAMKRNFDSLNVSAAGAIIIYRMSHAVE